MSRKGQSITLSVSDRDKAQLEALALEFGKKWGDRPNISKLVEAIARRQILIAPNHDWTDSRIDAINRAVDALIDAGQVDQATELAQLLLERSEPSLPIRQHLQSLVKNPPPAWRQELDRYILRQQPFRLTYQDAAGRLFSFHVYRAEVNAREKRIYIDCWCEETEGNKDIEELQHNWCLRLDHIPEAAIAPIPGKWRPKLDLIPVEFHLFGHLAFAYKSKSGDRISELLPESPPIRRVVREVAHTFWFFREIAPYWEDCAIASPPNVRELFRQKLIALCDRYQVDIPQ
ncbi:MAG: WYL domain-containing protein [Actinomycetota bacterium]